LLYWYKRCAAASGTQEKSGPADQKMPMQMKARKNLPIFTPVLLIFGFSSFLDTGSTPFSQLVIARSKALHRMVDRAKRRGNLMRLLHSVRNDNSLEFSLLRPPTIETGFLLIFIDFPFGTFTWGE
jgi:hypothetical protein